MKRAASDPDLRLERVTELPEDFDDIVQLSLQENFGAMKRMREDWDSGVNRFDRPGEVLVQVRIGAQLVGICGLNRDPYAQAPEVGRVRHLYVVPEFRRRGVGQLLVSEIVKCASRSFSRVRLRTLDAEAAQFYEALGFHTVAGAPDVTHEMDSPSSTLGRLT